MYMYVYSYVCMDVKKDVYMYVDAHACIQQCSDVCKKTYRSILIVYTCA